MKRTILLSNHYEGLPLHILEEAAGSDFNLKILSSTDKEELIAAVGDADYLLVSGRLKIDKEVIDHAHNIRMIQRTGVGLDNIDLLYLKTKGIPLYVNHGVNANSVAEYTVMLMLSTLKRSYAINNQIRRGIWKKQETALTTHEIFGRTVGIVGMGNIGRRVAKLLIGFDVKIIYTDMKKMSDEEEKGLCVSYSEFDELLERSDIITLHCPYDERTGYLIAENEIAKMKPGTIIINTARGKLVKQQAVADALRTERIAAVGIDTFEEEPVQAGCEYFDSDEVLLSPHIAGLSYEAFERMIRMAVENIRLFDKGEKELISSNLYM